MKYKTTADIKVPKAIVEQVIGQEEAVKVMKEASGQRRHVLLIGKPGTGKSMLGLAMAEMLPKENLKDIMSFANPHDDAAPLIREVKAGEGRRIMAQTQAETGKFFKFQNIIFFGLLILAMVAPWYAFNYYSKLEGGSMLLGGVMFAALFLGAMAFLGSFMIFQSFGKRGLGGKKIAPKVIVDNFKKKQAPFFDATGSHAGALLGDVLHDPFQCFLPSMKLTVIENGIKRKIPFQQLDTYFKNKNILKKPHYEAVFLNSNELRLSGFTNENLSNVEGLSINRHDYDGKLVKITTDSGKEIILTPEHKLAVNNNSEIEFIESRQLNKGQKIIASPSIEIINENNIIQTYKKKQQNQASLYKKFLQIKKKNPSWGYKRISKLLNQPKGKTRWWNSKIHKPVPCQTVEELKDIGILPLKEDNPNILKIARIMGSLFGDGGIFANLNGIFLSSSNKEDLLSFQEDLESVFNLTNGENSRIFRGGEKGVSWCYQNTNRRVIRFFMSLGAPIGNKSTIKLNIPSWIYLSNKFADEFFGALFGSELGVPKLHKNKNRLQTFDFAITGPDKFELNRMEFMNQIKRYLETKGVKCTSIYQRLTKTGLILYRLNISTLLDNVLQFLKNVKIMYCEKKKIKLMNAIEDFRGKKIMKYKELRDRGYGAEHAMKVLNLSPKSLFFVLSNSKIEVCNEN